MTAPQKKTSAQTSVPFSPMTAASAHGLTCSFHQLGELKWSGTVFVDDETPVFVEEMASSWRATMPDGKTVTKSTLDLLLKAIT